MRGNIGMSHDSVLDASQSGCNKRNAINDAMSEVRMFSPPLTRCYWPRERADDGDLPTNNQWCTRR